MLDHMLRLRWPAVAVKMIDDEDKVPQSAKRPKKDMGQHLALCQAYTLARRQGKILYMGIEDQWCWTPPMLLGLADGGPGTVGFQNKVRTVGVKDPDKAEEFVRSFPRFPLGQYKGILIAPLDNAPFEPDVILIYCAPYQLRLIITAINTQTGKTVDASLSPLESCCYSVIPPIKTGEYAVTVPDPGECDRAAVDDSEMIFSVPKEKFAEFFSGLSFLSEKGRNVNKNSPVLLPDFPRPPFYNQVYEDWGLETDPGWKK